MKWQQELVETVVCHRDSSLLLQGSLLLCLCISALVFSFALRWYRKHLCFDLCTAYFVLSDADEEGQFHGV